MLEGIWRLRISQRVDFVLSMRLEGVVKLFQRLFVVIDAPVLVTIVVQDLYSCSTDSVVPRARQKPLRILKKEFTEISRAVGKATSYLCSQLRPHVYIVEAQMSICTDVDSQCCTSTDPDLSCLVVTAQVRKTEFHTPIALHELSHLHTIVAEQVQ